VRIPEFKLQSRETQKERRRRRKRKKEGRKEGRKKGNPNLTLGASQH
jgi:hypothetical protein